MEKQTSFTLETMDVIKDIAKSNVESIRESSSDSDSEGEEQEII